MKKFKMKGFTLIELIAVLVIMAILALIVIPLVMSIIRKARVSADRRSIDAYGRAIELAIASYLLDNGTFPTSIDDLTIEYSGAKVVCSTTQLNPDSSVYLSGCKVNNRDVNYEYVTDKTPSYTAYSAGDTVKYSNIDFYVIKDSGIKEDTVTLLKAEPLTVDEVNTYGGVGTANNHVNRYTGYNHGTAYNRDNRGYGAMAYYTSETCGYVNNGNIVDTGCTTSYAQSDIKYVIDAWVAANIPSGVIEARLVNSDDIDQYVDYRVDTWNIVLPEFFKSVFIYYWTMIPSLFSNENPVFGIMNSGKLNYFSVYEVDMLVRPVIVLPKSVLQS